MTKAANKESKSQAFVKSLDECKSSTEIFDLLHENMDKATLKDRTRHVSDQHLVVSFHAQAARCNSQLGNRITHEDYVNMAADKYHQLTNNEMPRFKIELNKYLVHKEIAQNKEKTTVQAKPKTQVRPEVLQAYAAKRARG